MGRAPCCDKASVKRGPWSPEEDAKLKEFIEKYGTGGNWIALPQKAGLKRCGKSCRLRWLNYLRPNIKHGEFSEQEDRIICNLYATIGSRWSIIAAQLPGRTDNDIKNYWNTKLKKKLMMGMFSTNHTKLSPFSGSLAAPPPPPPPPPLQAQSLSSLSQLLRDCSLYSSQAKSLLTSHDQSILISPNLLFNNNNISLPTNHSYVHQIQEGLMNHAEYYYPLKDPKMLMFGSNEASCSSSDGSCSQISYGKEIKQEDASANCLQGYISTKGYEDQEPHLMLNYGNNIGGNNPNGAHSLGAWTTDHKQTGVFGDLQVQCDLEEVKQLISYSSSNVCNDNSFYLNDENKTHERTMYFY